MKTNPLIPNYQVIVFDSFTETSTKSAIGDYTLRLALIRARKMVKELKANQPFLAKSYRTTQNTWAINYYYDSRLIGQLQVVVKNIKTKTIYL